MSDTDDTDLLLLIPPDFFLVNSPDLGFDSDCDINLEYEQSKDTIVSDLITQVNDLESRICMIENLERSATHCSTCNEESFIDQSINSLTESDVLRSEVKKQFSAVIEETSNANYMPKSFEQNPNPGCNSFKKQLEDNVACTNKLVSCENTKPNVIDISDVRPFNYVENKLVKPYSDLEVNLQKTRKTELLNEIDSFIETRKNTIYNHSTQIVRSENTKLNSIETGKTNVSLEPDFAFPSETDYLLETESTDPEQSLALPEVYKLLEEMEETQCEIEKKLRLHDSPQYSNPQRNTDDTVSTNPNIINGSKVIVSRNLDMEDLYNRSSKPTFNKQTESVLDKMKSLQGRSKHSDIYRSVNNSDNTQLNYLFTSTPPIFNDGITAFQRNSSLKKSVSPSRTLLSHNPIDIVKANLPRKEIKDNSSHFGDDKDSLTRRPNFRRHLNFERVNSSLRTSKSRPLLQMEHEGYQSENQGLTVESVHRKSGPSNHSIEQTLNTLATDRANTHDQINCKTSSSEMLQQKISSSNLLSLSELWNKEPTFYSDDPNKLRQKLEEEKYRRQHCEQQIQVLQLRVLEEQEKLAVAIKVDQEKDKAILQITESWKKLNDHWGELEEQRHNLAQQLQEEKELTKIKNDEITKKIERWEKEVSQALDLAAGYKEKSEVSQKQMEILKRETEVKLEESNLRIHNITEENENLNRKNKNLLEQLKSLEEKIEEEEELLSKLKIELENSNERYLEYEAENNVLKEQKESLAIKLKEEKNLNSILEKHKNNFEQAVSEATKREKAAKEEVRVSNERIEVARTELRALYQGQLETVVKEKLQEFQRQLEAAESALKSELHSKEKQWADQANEQCRQLQEKYKIDLQRMNESHREELNKWRMKLMESERLRSNSESKLQEETNRRADIAQRLHSVMETQWREALNIISNPIQNLYELPKDENRKWPSNHRSSERLKGCGDLKASRSNSSSSLAQAEESPFCKDGMITCRKPQPTQDHQLKKYIQMLLERGPGNPTPQHDLLQESLDSNFCPENSLLDEKWMLDCEKKSGGNIERLGQSSKPPWK